MFVVKILENDQEVWIFNRRLSKHNGGYRDFREIRKQQYTSDS